MIAPNGGWVAQAACRACPEVFYTHKRTTLRDIEVGLALCQGCPVRKPCLREALEHDEPWGIWGGTTEEQRAWARAGDGQPSTQWEERLLAFGSSATRGPSPLRRELR